ncbi:hypothetical protein [Streptomyces sp. NPDC060184]|uniref:hypothetical protein n=1 Tax=Streptomyces sp. NPDC060184 TaxID=3347064 RepID=UPI00365D1372
MADHFMPAPVRAPLTRVPLSEPATVDACRADYAAAATFRARFDENAKRFVAPSTGREAGR